MQPIQVVEITFGDLPPQFFLVDQETASTLVLEKETNPSQFRRRWIYFRREPGSLEYFGFPIVSSGLADPYLVHLLLQEITRQAGVEVKTMINDHPHARKIIGERFDHFINERPR